MPRVVFVNRYFHPDHSATSQLLSDLVFDLAEGGIEVVVITSRQLYDDARADLPVGESVHGVAVRRVGATRFGRARLIGRAVDSLGFALTAAIALTRLSRRGDVVVAMTDPPLISVVAAGAARMRGARLVNWLQDVFPEVAAELGVAMTRGTPGALLRVLRDASLRAAAVNVVLGEAMAGRIVGRGIERARIRVVPNWSDGDAVRPRPAAGHPLRAAWGLDGRFVAGYSGNLGRAHDAETMIGAAGLLRDDPTIAFLFVGGGIGRVRLERARAEEGLGNVVLRPYLPWSELGLGLTAPDAHLVSLRPELEGLIVPSKVYGALAAGRPIVFIGAPDGEIARLVREADCGLVIAQGDASGLASALRGLVADPVGTLRMGTNARAVFERRFTRARALAAWRAVLGV